MVFPKSLSLTTANKEVPSKKDTHPSVQEGPCDPQALFPPSPELLGAAGPSGSEDGPSDMAVFFGVCVCVLLPSLPPIIAPVGRYQEEYASTWGTPNIAVGI